MVELAQESDLSLLVKAAVSEARKRGCTRNWQFKPLENHQTTTITSNGLGQGWVMVSPDRWIVTSSFGQACDFSGSWGNKGSFAAFVEALLVLDEALMWRRIGAGDPQPKAGIAVRPQSGLGPGAVEPGERRSWEDAELAQSRSLGI